MRLELGDRVISESATEREVAAALAQPGARDESWSLLLESDDDFLVADGTEGARGYELQCSLGEERLDAEAELDDRALQALFTSFLNRTAAWRSACAWTPHVASSGGSALSLLRGAKLEPPTIFGLVFVALLFVLSWIPRDWVAPHLPEALQERGTWFVVLFAVGMPAMVVTAVLVKMVQVRRAATWAQGTAKIVRSEITTETRRSQGESTKTVNLPAIHFEYEVEGRRYRCDRIAIGEIAPDDPRIPELLARYRVGAQVPVYYDPANPQAAALERDVPEGIVRATAFVIAFVALFTFSIAGWFLFPEAIRGALAPHLPANANPHLFLFFSLVTALLMLRFVSVRRMSRAAADGWRMALGEIVTSRIETHREGVQETRTTMSYAMIAYRYTVDGREYGGSRIGFGPEIGGSPWIVKRRLDKYPAGKPVQVWYDPKNPAQAVLEKESGGLVGGLLPAVIFAGLAWFFAHHGGR